MTSTKLAKQSAGISTRCSQRTEDDFHSLNAALKARHVHFLPVCESTRLTKLSRGRARHPTTEVSCSKSLGVKKATYWPRIPGSKSSDYCNARMLPRRSPLTCGTSTA